MFEQNGDCDQKMSFLKHYEDYIYLISILAHTSDKTGVRVSLDELDLSRMNTKPFEPKLPLPEAFESQLMKSAIAQLQPVVNQYLTAKPLYLPENISPLAAAPLVNLWSTGNGTGYAEILSYCTCDEETNTPFAICDVRSKICSNQDNKSLRMKGEKIFVWVIHKPRSPKRAYPRHVEGVQYVLVPHPHFG